MTVTRLARILGRLVAVIVLTASGIYFIVYLYRWEWNRAQISGLIFVATELAVLGSRILERLNTLDRKLDGRPGASPADSAAGSASDAAPAPRPDPPRFMWLDPNRTGVFIPVLLGAGAVLAALAYVIERIAAYVVGDSDTQVRHLDRMAYPASGLAADSPAPTLTAPRMRHRRTGRAATALIGSALAALLVVAGINVLADYTQSRPDPTDLTGVTEITLHIGYRMGETAPAEDTARALFESCRLRLPTRARFVTGPTEVTSRTVVATIEPALGRLGVRRLRGCLQDYTLDGVLAEVKSVRHIP